MVEDAVGNVHAVRIGQGGRQGDAKMRLLLSLGDGDVTSTASLGTPQNAMRRQACVHDTTPKQHHTLAAIVDEFGDAEFLFPKVDDVHSVTAPDWDCRARACPQEHFRGHFWIRIDERKTWCGIVRRRNVLERIAQVSNGEGRVWRGSKLPSRLQMSWRSLWATHTL